MMGSQSKLGQTVTVKWKDFTLPRFKNRTAKLVFGGGSLTKSEGRQLPASHSIHQRLAVTAGARLSFRSCFTLDR